MLCLLSQSCYMLNPLMLYVGFEAITEVTTRGTIAWNVISCSRYITEVSKERFASIVRVEHYSRFAYSPALKWIQYSTSVNLYRTARRHIPEDLSTYEPEHT
jgi:hypothetical protein